MASAIKCTTLNTIHTCLS